MIDEKDVEYKTIFDDVNKLNSGERILSPELQAVQGPTIDSLPPIPEEALAQTNQVAVEKQEPAQEAPSPEPQPESREERNFKILRAQREKVERERDELAQQLARMYQQPPVQHPQETNPNPDDLVEWKHVDKRIKDLESKIQGYQQQSQESVIEARLKTQYPDFDSVVSRDNIDILKAEYPELADTLNSSSNLYSKAVSAYTLIKKLGIQQDDNSYADRARLQKNMSKPKPLASISPQKGDSPLSKANAFAEGLTDSLKEQLRKEMYAAIKNK